MYIIEFIFLSTIFTSNIIPPDETIFPSPDFPPSQGVYRINESRNAFSPQGAYRRNDHLHSTRLFFRIPQYF